MTPKTSPSAPVQKKKVQKTLFPEDNSSFSQSEEEESTGTYAAKVTTKTVFKFRKLGKHDKQVPKQVSPSSSPINLPSPSASASTIVISSDEELERSMIALEQQISLEMNDSD